MKKFFGVGGCRFRSVDRELYGKRIIMECENIGSNLWRFCAAKGTSCVLNWVLFLYVCRTVDQES